MLEMVVSSQNPPKRRVPCVQCPVSFVVCCLSHEDTLPSDMVFLVFSRKKLAM
jgi:hypothetical protein